MRSSILVTAACALALAACSKPASDKAPAGSADASIGPAATPASAPAPSIGDGAPDVKAGLWEMKLNVAGGRVKATSRICIDPAVQGVGAAYGQRYSKEDCSQSSFTRTAGGIDFKSTCDVSGVHVVSSGQVRGDLSSHYTVDVDSTTTRDGVTKTSKIQSEATRIGDCPAGMAPGDQQMTVNGRTITIKVPPGA